MRAISFNTAARQFALDANAEDCVRRTCRSERSKFPRLGDLAVRSKNDLLDFALSAAVAPGSFSRAQRPRGRFRGLDFARLDAAEMALSQGRLF